MILAMHRRSVQSTLSPRLLKHFAAVTVVLTALLAVFAGGEDWGAKAQIDAVQAKNQLAATEAAKLGTRRVASTLKIADSVGAARFGDDEGIAVSNGGGGAYAPLIPRRPVVRKPLAALANPSNPPVLPGLPGSQPPTAEAAPSAPPSPSAQDLIDITASSARRSGASGDGN